MILTCPQCATRYQMDDDKLPSGGRKVRCTKGGHVWFHETPIAPPEPALDRFSQPEAPPPERSPPPQPPPLPHPPPPPEPSPALSALSEISPAPDPPAPDPPPAPAPAQR